MSKEELEVEPIPGFGQFLSGEFPGPTDAVVRQQTCKQTIAEKALCKGKLEGSDTLKPIEGVATDLQMHGSSKTQKEFQDTKPHTFTALRFPHRRRSRVEAIEGRGEPRAAGGLSRPRAAGAGDRPPGGALVHALGVGQATLKGGARNP